MRFYDYNKQLYHYGIKGMKWGVRRYQNKDGSLTAAGKQHYKDVKINKKIEDYISSGKAKVSSLSHYTVAGLTTMTTKTGEKYISGLMDGHDFDWQEVTNYNELGGYVSPSRVLKEYDTAHRISEHSGDALAHKDFRFSQTDLRKCNPDFGKPGTTQNCAKCSATLEMRLRGYDISAGRQTFPSSVDAQSLWFKDAQRVDYDYDIAEEALRSYGPKTSGTLSYKYPGGTGGHAVHWTNDSTGNFQIQDGQNGRTFSSILEMMDAYGGDKTSSLSTFRLDNCEPNFDAMEQDSVLRRANTASKVKNRFTERIVDTW